MYFACSSVFKSHQILQLLVSHTAFLAFGILTEHFPDSCCLQEWQALKKKRKDNQLSIRKDDQLLPYWK